MRCIWCGAQGSLRRLGQSSVGLYQIHWPGFPLINNWATEAFVEGLATVQQAGLAKVCSLVRLVAHLVEGCFVGLVSGIMTVVWSWCQQGVHAEVHP